MKSIPWVLEKNKPFSKGEPHAGELERRGKAVIPCVTAR